MKTQLSKNKSCLYRNKSSPDPSVHAAQVAFYLRKFPEDANKWNSVRLWDLSAEPLIISEEEVNVFSVTADEITPQFA